MQTVNEELMLGHFGHMALFAIFVIIFLAMVSYTNNPRKSMAYTSLMVAVIAVFMKSLSLVNDYAVLITWIIVGISVAMLVFSKD